jgi:hypothetical protein
VTPPGLGAAVGLLTAMTGAGGDPAFFWDAVTRVMADAQGPDELAQLVFGQAALAQILLRHLADTSGATPQELLGQLVAAYSGPSVR